MLPCAIVSQIWLIGPLPQSVCLCRTLLTIADSGLLSTLQWCCQHSCVLLPVPLSCHPLLCYLRSIDTLLPLSPSCTYFFFTFLFFFSASPLLSLLYSSLFSAYSLMSLLSSPQSSLPPEVSSALSLNSFFSLISLLYSHVSTCSFPFSIYSIFLNHKKKHIYKIKYKVFGRFHIYDSAPRLVKMTQNEFSPVR